MIPRIQERLFALQDKPYAAFQAKLIPTVLEDTIIGVRTPLLRSYAKEAAKLPEKDAFLSDLPHQYFDENQLHAFLISEEKDFQTCLRELEAFLPYIDNWATCDQLSPKVFKKHLSELEPYIDTWMASGHTYTVRFGVGMLMRYYLDDAFSPKYPEKIARIRSEEYYINMMIAWYFATALAKQYDAVVPYIEEKRLDDWTHNRAIQKAIESYRITPEQKEYLKSLKIKARRTS